MSDKREEMRKDQPPMRPGPGGPGRGPGRGGPGGRFAMPVEKPKNAGATLKRLVKYFKKELNMVIAL
ncbi:MAG: hypothetical protein IJF27_04105, partial [Oscillospiraceae bacterium]|nr:hypothetical protein [Oscillospiraceae bacterium]